VQLRERKKAALRDTIVRNAVEMFQKRGFDAVSVDEIVHASMCSRSTFHRYFGTKEDLLFPTADATLDGLRDALNTAEADEDPWMVARRAVTVQLDRFVDDLAPDLRPVILHLWFHELLPRRRYLDIVLQWDTLLATFFASHLGVDPAASLECQLLASAISSTLRAAMGVAMHTGQKVELLTEQAFTLIETGLNAELLTLRAAT
jgi:AcrR family transcriptional regulator